LAPNFIRKCISEVEDKRNNKVIPTPLGRLGVIVGTHWCVGTSYLQCAAINFESERTIDIVIRVARDSFLCLLLICTVSCSPPRPKGLVKLPVVNNLDLLDSAQAQAVFKYFQYFPNETEIALVLMTGESQKHVGIRRRHDSLIYVENLNKVFEIGSITKTFTATILAKLVYDGQFNLNEPIKNILPVTLHQSALNGKEVTIFHLANHTSGFPKEPDNVSTDWAIPGSPYRSYDTTKLYDYLSKRLTLQSTPGEKREYSNLGGGLLGHLLTLITGKSYEDLLRESICKPLGLRNTFVALDSARKQQLVWGRDPEGNVVPNWELNVLAGGGEIKSTAEDMAKYIRMHITDTTYYLLTQQSTLEYTEHNSAGLGWTWYTNGSNKYVSATGGTGGYSCCVIFERSTKTGIILLTNVSAFLALKGEYIVKMSRELYDPLPLKVRSE
jgi:CubicO group peptidase (beta-lactamase class C family)